MFVCNKVSLFDPDLVLVWSILYFKIWYRILPAVVAKKIPHLVLHAFCFNSCNAELSVSSALFENCKLCV